MVGAGLVAGGLELLARLSVDTSELSKIGSKFSLGGTKEEGGGGGMLEVSSILKTGVGGILQILGVVSILGLILKSSTMLQEVFGLFFKSIMLIIRPIGDILALFLLPFILAFHRIGFGFYAWAMKFLPEVHLITNLIFAVVKFLATVTVSSFVLIAKILFNILNAIISVALLLPKLFITLLSGLLSGNVSGAISSMVSVTEDTMTGVAQSFINIAGDFITYLGETGIALQELGLDIANATYRLVRTLSVEELEQNIGIINGLILLATSYEDSGKLLIQTTANVVVPAFRSIGETLQSILPNLDISGLNLSEELLKKSDEIFTTFKGVVDKMNAYIEEKLAIVTATPEVIEEAKTFENIDTEKFGYSKKFQGMMGEEGGGLLDAFKDVTDAIITSATEIRNFADIGIQSFLDITTESANLNRVVNNGKDIMINSALAPIPSLTLLAQAYDRVAVSARNAYEAQEKLARRKAESSNISGVNIRKVG